MNTNYVWYFKLYILLFFLKGSVALIMIQNENIFFKLKPNHNG